jgi:hypothetical protein
LTEKTDNGYHDFGLPFGVNVILTEWQIAPQDDDT